MRRQDLSVREVARRLEARSAVKRESWRRMVRRYIHQHQPPKPETRRLLEDALGLEPGALD